MPNNIQITITTDAGTVDLTTRELTAAEVDLFKDFCWWSYPQTVLNETTNELDELPRTPANEAKAVRDWIRGIFRGTAANLRRFKQAQAQPAPEPEIDLEA